MLFIENITKLIYGKYIEGTYYVKDNQFWKSGHFPNNPIFPGFLAVEVLAQLSAFLYCDIEKIQSIPKQDMYLSKIIDMKFIRQIRIHDTMTMKVSAENMFGGFSQVSCIALVEDQVAIKGHLVNYIEEVNL